MSDPAPIRQEIKVDYDGKPIDELNADLAQAAQGSNQAENQTRQSAATAKTYGQAINELENQLEEIITTEDRYRQSLTAGEQETEESAEASKRRRTGIDLLNRELADNRDAQERVNREMKRGVDAHRQLDTANSGSTDKIGVFGQGLGVLGRSVASLIPGLSAAGGLAWAMQQVETTTKAANEELQKNIDLAREATKSTLDLQALSLTFSPGDEDFLGQMAEISGRDRVELAPEFTSFKSGTSGFLDAEQQRKKFEQLVVIPGLGTGGSLSGLTDLATRASGIVDDEQSLRNLQALTVNAAGEGDANLLTKTVAQLLPTARGLDVEVSDTAALQAVGSRIYGANESKTKLEQLLIRMLADPEVFKLLEKEGVTPDQDFFGRLDTLRRANTPTERLVKIANTENVGMLEALLERGGEVEAARRDIGRYDDGEDLFTNFLEDLYTQSPRARFFKIGDQQQQKKNEREIGKESYARTAGAKGALANVFAELRDTGEITQASIDSRLERYDELVALGQDPIEAIEFVEGPNRGVPGPGTLLKNTPFSLGTSDFIGIREEVVRRLAVGVDVGDGYIGPLPGSEELKPVPIGVARLGRGYEGILNTEDSEYPGISEVGRIFSEVQSFEKPLRELGTPLPEEQPSRGEPLSSSGDSQTHQMLGQLIGAVQRLSVPSAGSGEPADVFGGSAVASGPGTGIHGDVFTGGDPRFGDFSDGYRNT